MKLVNEIVKLEQVILENENNIVDDEFNEENNTLSYNQLMEWDKDDLAHHILSYQEEAERTRNQAKYPY